MRMYTVYNRKDPSMLDFIANFTVDMSKTVYYYLLRLDLYLPNKFSYK